MGHIDCLWSGKCLNVISTESPENSGDEGEILNVSDEILTRASDQMEDMILNIVMDLKNGLQEMWINDGHVFPPIVKVLFEGS